MYKYPSLSSQKGDPHHLSQTRRGQTLAKAVLPGAPPAELRFLSQGPPRLLQAEELRNGTGLAHTFLLSSPGFSQWCCFSFTLLQLDLGIVLTDFSKIKPAREPFFFFFF